MKPGTKVRMSARLRAAFRRNDSREHVQEFGGCVGIVIDLAFENGPEVNVRWLPSYLRYAYDPKYLVVSRKKVRGWKNKAELARRIAALKAV